MVVLDAGFASEKNISMLEEKGYTYLVNVTRGSRKKYAKHFAEEEFQLLPDRSDQKQVEVKSTSDPENQLFRMQNRLSFLSCLILT